MMDKSCSWGKYDWTQGKFAVRTTIGIISTGKLAEDSPLDTFRIHLDRVLGHVV